MKLKIKMVAVGSLIAFVASPLAMAGNAAGGDAAVDPEVTVEVSPVDELVDPPVVEDDSAGEPGEEIIIHCGTVGGEGDPEVQPICDKELADCENPEACEIPIEWVIRGGGELENPDVIFYTMADGGVGAPAPAVAKDEVVLGQDDKAAVIAGKGAATPQILREKKGPVALVKKGRVFLR